MQPGMEGWGVEFADNRVAADAVDCVSGAEAWAATWSFGKESDTKETTIASYNGGPTSSLSPWCVKIPEGLGWV